MTESSDISNLDFSWIGIPSDTPGSQDVRDVDPSPQQIKERAEIRSTWNEAEYRDRAGLPDYEP